MEVTLISIEASPSLIFPVMQEMIIRAGHKCKSIQVSIDDTTEEFDKGIAKQIANIAHNSELIGISCMTYTYQACINLINNLKPLVKAKFVVGGVHPTVKPQDFVGYSDYICVGEGENALLDLIEKMAKHKKTDSIPNIYVSSKNKLKINPLRPILKNLNTLPTPEFNFEDTYMEYEGQIHKLKDRKDIIPKIYSKYYYIITSRGCPYRCTYCLNNALINVHKEFSIIRRRNNEHILNELKNIKKVLPKDIIIGFVDDDFCAQSIDNLKQFCQKYKEQIGLRFFCASTPSSMNEEKLKCLLNAGMIRLEIGVQSISDKINHEVFHRFTTKKQVIDLAKVLEKYRYKLQICYDFILDNPWETEETRLETLNFILHLKKPFTASLFSLTTYPGTSLYERAKKEGRIKSDSELYKKNHMILQNHSVNTSILLYTEYNLPKSLVVFLVKNRNIWPINNILSKGTYFLHRSYNYFLGLKDSIYRNDKILRDYYLAAPFKLIFKKINIFSI